MTVRKPFRYGVLLVLILAFASQVHIQMPTRHDPYGSLDWGAGSVFAQSPPIPTQLPVRGVVNVTSTGTGSLLTLPSATTQPGVRNYVYQVKCMNYTSGAAVATLYSSSATVATVVGYVNCPASMAAMGGDGFFNPPLVLAVNAALVVTVSTTNGTTNNAYLNASGFTAR